MQYQTHRTHLALFDYGSQRVASTPLFVLIVLSYTGQYRACMRSSCIIYISK